MSGDDMEAWVADQRDRAADSLSVGDPLEVRCFTRHNQDGFWRAATIVFVTDRQIGVAFSDHSRLAVPRNSGGPKRWRKP
jgi:hypothetical protein